MDPEARRNLELAAPGKGGFPYMDDVLAACATPGLDAVPDELMYGDLTADGVPYYISIIKSAVGLEAAIDKAEAAGYLAPPALIIAMPLPTMRLGSCRLLLEAATEGTYRGFGLQLRPPEMPQRKLDAGEAVDEARRILEDARRPLRAIPRVKAQPNRAQDSVRAEIAALCWDRDVEGVRVAADSRIGSTDERLQCLLTRLAILL